MFGYRYISKYYNIRKSTRKNTMFGHEGDLDHI